MQRELKRVPLDFDYPLDTVWHGYMVLRSVRLCASEGEDACRRCRKMAELKKIPMTHYGCPDTEKYFSEAMKKLEELCEPPKGDGFQLWETVSEGGPISPVFKTPEELSAWCATNVPAFAHYKISKEEWLEDILNMLKKEDEPTE